VHKDSCLSEFRTIVMVADSTAERPSDVGNFKPVQVKVCLVAQVAVTFITI